MADPLGAQQPQGLPDRLRSGRLSRVRDAVQPGGPGRVEVRLELRPGYADLGAAEAEPDQRVGPVVQRVLQGRVGGGEPALAGDVVDPAQHQPEVPLGRDPGVLDRLGVGLDGDPRHDRGVRRAGELGVPEVLALHLARDLVGEQPDVLGGPDQVDDGEVHLDEVGEVAERVELPQLLGVAGHDARGAGPPARHDACGRGTDVMDMELGLGQAGDEGRETHPSESVSGSRRTPKRRGSGDRLQHRLRALLRRRTGRLAVDQDRRASR